MLHGSNDQSSRPNIQRGKGDADICIVGGAGHVGLPLALVLASKGHRVRIYDLNQEALAKIRGGVMPFAEADAEPLLHRVLAENRLSFSASADSIADVATVVVTIGTPIDEFLNPEVRIIKKWADQSLPFLTDGQLLILRSTVYPGTTQWLEKYLTKAGKDLLLAYCPERIVQGFAVRELQSLPQIISGTTPEAEEAVATVFSSFAPQVVRLSPLEAEFAKLFANSYRYIEFAIANQFYTIAHSAGVDYNRVLDGLQANYPRGRGIPRAGFTAGPCLVKDTMQLAAFSQNQFPLGHAAMLVNEGLVLYLVDDLKRRYPLSEMVVGLLGMAFKADCDDTRSSLSYKLKKLLKLVTADVVTTDPHVTTDPELLPVEAVIERSDLLILCTPHAVYRSLDTRGKPVIDVWGYWRDSARPVVAVGSGEGRGARGEGRGNMSRPLRIAVIGLGFGQQVHVPAFRADSRCEVTTVCASTEAKAAEVARRLQVPHASGDWRVLVAGPEIDAVSIAVPPRLQPAIAIAALRQGKAVFCEKPLAADIDDAWAARKAAENAGRPNMLNFEFGESDAWRHVQELIDSNRIGRITSVDVDWRVQTYANRNRLENWKSRPEDGGGALQAFVAHTFYYLERFAGPITWLQARLAKAIDDPRTGETEAVLEAKFVAGGRATIYVATDAPPPHRHRIDIVGDAGVLRLVNEESDYIAGFRALHTPGAGAKMTPVFPQSATRDEGDADGGAAGDGRVVATSRLVRKFVDWIVEGTTARPNFADGHRVQFLIEAARRSNAEGRWMDAPV